MRVVWDRVTVRYSDRCVVVLFYKEIENMINVYFEMSFKEKEREFFAIN